MKLFRVFFSVAYFVETFYKRSLFYKEPVLTDNLTEDKNPLAVVIGKRASWGEMWITVISAGTRITELT